MTSNESDNSILMDGVVPVTALVMLACGLPGDTELDGDLRPPDTELDGVVDQRCEFDRAPRCITLPNGSLRVRRSEYQRWLAAREEAA